MKSTERVWWTWANDEVDEAFDVVETERCLTLSSGKQPPADDAEGARDVISDCAVHVYH